MVRGHRVVTEILATLLGFSSGLRCEHLGGSDAILRLMEFVVGLFELTIDLVHSCFELCELGADLCCFGALIGDRIGAGGGDHERTGEHCKGCANGNEAKSHG